MYILLSVNPVLDVIFKSPAKRSEGRQFFSATSLSAGGFAANAARALKCMGETPLCLFLSGGATGQILHSALRTEGIEFEGIPTQAGTRIAATWPSRRGPRMLVSPSPAPGEAAMAAILHEALRRSTPEDIVLAGGSSPPPSELGYLQLLQSLASERRCYLDVRTSRVDRLIAARPFVLKLPSRKEKSLRRFGSNQTDQLRRAVEGGVYLALQSFGSRHLLAATQEVLLHGVAPEVQIVNSFGAGDCLIAALAVFLNDGLSVEAAIKRAMAAASASVLSSTPGLFEPKDAQRLEGQVSVRPLKKGGRWAF